MEIVFVTVFGAGFGLLIRYLLPKRDSYGILLLPAIGALATDAIWVALVWLGLKFDGGWIWAISLVAGALICLVVALVVPRVRKNEDERMLAALSR